MLIMDYDIVIVILDELTIPVSMGLLDEDDVIALMDEKPEAVELIRRAVGLRPDKAEEDGIKW